MLLLSLWWTWGWTWYSSPRRLVKRQLPLQNQTLGAGWREWYYPQSSQSLQFPVIREKFISASFKINVRERTILSLFTNIRKKDMQWIDHISLTKYRPIIQHTCWPCEFCCCVVIFLFISCMNDNMNINYWRRSSHKKSQPHPRSLTCSAFQVKLGGGPGNQAIIVYCIAVSMYLYVVTHRRCMCARSGLS